MEGRIEPCGNPSGRTEGITAPLGWPKAGVLFVRGVLAWLLPGARVLRSSSPIAFFGKGDGYLELLQKLLDLSFEHGCHLQNGITSLLRCPADVFACLRPDMPSILYQIACQKGAAPMPRQSGVYGSILKWLRCAFVSACNIRPRAVSRWALCRSFTMCVAKRNELHYEIEGTLCKGCGHAWN